MAWEEKLGKMEEKAAFRDGAQRSEIGDVLLSARAVSRKMIARAQDRADEIVKAAEARADEIVREAEKKAAEILRRAEAECDARLRVDAETPVVHAPAEELPAAEPEPEAVPPMEDRGLTRAEAERIRAEAAAEAQEYAVRCVEECFARLRQQQQENVDFINEQWQSFLCGLIPGEEGAASHEIPQPKAAEPAEPEISQQEIEAKVNAIARELMEIIGK